MTAKSRLSEPEVFVLADHALNDVVARIRDAEGAMGIPSSLATRRTDRRLTLREVVNYHAYDDSWVPDMLAGKTMAEAGVDKFKGDLLGEQPKLRFAEIVAKACAAVTGLDDLDRTVHLSFGEFPARGYLWQTNMFRGLRANDIAKVIGIHFELPEALVQGIWDEISPHAEEWRAIGGFSAAVPGADGAPLLAPLPGPTRRRPQAP